MASDEAGTRGNRLSADDHAAGLALVLEVVIPEHVKRETEMEMKQDITVRLNDDATDPRVYRTVEIHGVSAALRSELKEPAMTEARWRTIFAVFVEHEENLVRTRNSPIPMLGTYQIESELV